MSHHFFRNTASALRSSLLLLFLVAFGAFFVAGCGQDSPTALDVSGPDIAASDHGSSVDGDLEGDHDGDHDEDCDCECEEGDHDGDDCDDDCDHDGDHDGEHDGDHDGDDCECCDGGGTGNGPVLGNGLPV